MINLGYILGALIFLAIAGAARFAITYHATLRRLEQEDPR